MLNSVTDFGVKCTKIEVDCMDREAVNAFISEKLKLLPRLTRPLSDVVYHKTKRGNALFVDQFLKELSKEGLLRPSLTHRRWVWDHDEVQERKLPSDVVEFMSASLSRLPKGVLSALCVLSCFGATSNASLVERLEAEVEPLLSTHLATAISEGLLFKKDGQYRFIHDRVHEAVYTRIKPEEVCLHHFKYGLAICSVAREENDDTLLLVAVGQINLGGPTAVSDYEQGLMVANLNLVAGEKAMAMSDFFAAYSLKKGHWVDHYDLTLDLYMGASKCALANGNHSSLGIMLDQVLHYAKSPEDKSDIIFIKLTLLNYATKFRETIELGTNFLLKFGEELPKPITSDVVKT
jgi:predicted ATPase